MKHEYKQGLIIDGVNYNIPIVSIKRNADFLEKFAKRTEDGDIKIRTIGLYKNYTVSIGVIDDLEEYEKLYEHITDPVNRFHDVIVPDSTKNFTFNGYFSNIEDEILKVNKVGAKYQKLTFKMVSRKPIKRG